MPGSAHTDHFPAWEAQYLRARLGPVPLSSALPTWPVRFVLALVAVIVLAGPTPAHADGTYVVSQCRTPSGGSAGVNFTVDAWASSIDHAASTCPVGAYNLLMAPGVVHPKVDSMTARFYAPADTFITTYSLWRSVTVGAGSHYFFSVVELANEVENRVGPGCRGDSCRGLGTTSSPLSSSNLFVGRPATPIDAVGLYVSCGYSTADEPDCPAATPAISVNLYRADITLWDGSNPTFQSTPSGPLLSTTNTLTGPQQVSFQVADRGGGVALVGVEIDGNVVASGTFGDSSHSCAVPYTKPVPCPLTAGGTLTYDTSRIADGPHRLRVFVRDAAGNQTFWGPVTIKTYNTPPDMSCVPTPLAADGGSIRSVIVPTPTSSKAHPKGQPTLTMAYGRKAMIGGTLRDANGNQVPGASVCIASQDAGTSGPYTPITKVTTAANGTFSANLPTGASRSVIAIARVAGGAVVGTAKLRVQPRIVARPQRRTLRNGQLLVIDGRVSGGPIPQRGVALNLQAVRDGRWQGFADAFRTRPDGTFRFRYRFTRTLGVQRYRLRIRAYAQAGYPYQTGFSKALTIRVAGS